MKTTKVPKDVVVSKPSNNVARAAFNDVTNRASALDPNSGKPNAYKRTASNNSRPITNKRDADFKSTEGSKNDVANASDAEVEARRGAEKPRSMKSLKEIDSNVSKAVDAKLEVKRSVTENASPKAFTTGQVDLGDHGPPSQKTVLAQFKELNKSPNGEYLALASKDDECVGVASSYQYSKSFHDIDERDADDELCVTAYVEDMFSYFRDQEHRSTVDPRYMVFQLDINARMRAILIDWLALVCTKSKLSPDSFYLTVNILDRYLSLKKATKKNLQLIGTAALFIASKYEDIYHVPVDDLVFLCDRTYSIEQIYHMEESILKTLSYQISIPTAYKFLLRFLNAGHADNKIVYLSCYILELAMLNIDFIEYLPSELAAAVVFLARKAVGRNGWSPTLLKYAEYTEEEIVPVARAIIKAKANLPPDLNSSKKKYSSERKLKVALISLPSNL
eukprot:CCRYP_003449-RA/>CCRYP_003449-RA protein AED:0.37 eAED:0.37 QI:261/1/1/1/0/0/2/240/448